MLTPNLFPNSTKTGLHEFWTACSNVSLPWGLYDLQHFIRLPSTVTLPVHVNFSFGLITFSSTDAVDVINLKVEPGSYVSLISVFLHIS